jgi:hypothetical protein
MMHLHDFGKIEFEVKVVYVWILTASMYKLGRVAFGRIMFNLFK